MNSHIKGHLLAVVALLGGACSSTSESIVHGVVEGTDETFYGIATGAGTDDGTITLTSDRGTNCSGNVVYITRTEGRGVLHCSDGHVGLLRFASQGLRGEATGSLGARRLTLAFRQSHTDALTSTPDQQR